MITQERLEEILNERYSYKVKDIDYKVTAISLLRERIPYSVCKGIIDAAEHDIIYLCDTEDVLPYISEEDAEILADCGIFIDEENECLAFWA